MFDEDCGMEEKNHLLSLDHRRTWKTPARRSSLQAVAGNKGCVQLGVELSCPCADAEPNKTGSGSPTSTDMTSPDVLSESSCQISAAGGGSCLYLVMPIELPTGDPIPFHIRYPPYIAKSLSKTSESAITAIYKLSSFNDKQTKAAKENEEEFRVSIMCGQEFAQIMLRIWFQDEKRDRMTISRVLNDMHIEACLELSNSQREKLFQLEQRLTALYKGPPEFPKEVVLKDILPQGKYPNEVIQRLEDHCQVSQAIDNTLLTYNCFNQVTSLDKISLSELKIFCKDNRCSQRVLVKVPQIMLMTLRPEQEIVSDEEDVRLSPTQNNQSQPSVLNDSLNIKLAKFVECIVRISREQIPGKVMTKILFSA
eukprot:581338-Hanusia_phi.AAC.6